MSKLNKAQKEIATLKYETIKKYKDDELCIAEASIILNVTQNYIYTLARRFDNYDLECYANKNIGVPINLKINEDTENMIVEAFKDMCTKLEENTIIVIGRNKNWFIRPTYKFFFDKIVEQVILSKSSVIKVLKKNNLHSSRSKIKSTTSRISVSNNDRIKQSGFEVQLDGKVGIKFPDDDFTCVAHMAVDAGTNKILAIHFDQGETNFGYINIIKTMFFEHGIPHIIVTDCRTSFTTNRECGDKNVVISRALKNLVVQLITTSNAKRKNKVESKNDVIQTRILHELMCAGIKTMNEANEVISAVLDVVNADLNNIDTEKTYFTKFPDNMDFNKLFITKHKRVVQKYSQIVFENINYFAVSKDKTIIHMKKGTKVKVLESHTGELEVKYRGNNHKLVIANEESIKEYEINYIFKEKRFYKKSRNDFFFNNMTYHIVDNLDNHVPIKENSTLVKVFDKENKLLHVLLNKTIFHVVEGKAPIKTDEKEIILEEKKVSFNYDGTFKINNKVYFLKENNKMVVFEPRTKLNVILENGIATYVKHEKKMISCYDINHTKVGLIQPRSHLEALRIFRNPQIIIKYSTIS